jgi:hypothetical protein
MNIEISELDETEKNASKDMYVIGLVIYVGLEVLTAVTMKSMFTIFWDITPCNPTGAYRRFRDT